MFDLTPPRAGKYLLLLQKDHLSTVFILYGRGWGWGGNDSFSRGSPNGFLHLQNCHAIN